MACCCSFPSSRLAQPRQRSKKDTHASIRLSPSALERNLLLRPGRQRTKTCLFSGDEGYIPGKSSAVVQTGMHPPIIWDSNILSEGTTRAVSRVHHDPPRFFTAVLLAASRPHKKQKNDCLYCAADHFVRRQRNTAMGTLPTYYTYNREHMSGFENSTIHDLSKVDADTSDIISLSMQQFCFLPRLKREQPATAPPRGLTLFGSYLMHACVKNKTRAVA